MERWHAVGMATSIPHNLGEIINATIAFINNKSTIGQLMKYVQVSFPTGGVIIGKDIIKQGYNKGEDLLKYEVR